MRENGLDSGRRATRVPTPGSLFALADIYGALDLTGAGPPDVPWGATPSLEAFRRAMEAGAPYLPERYRRSYVAPVEDSLAGLLEATGDGAGDDPAETVLGAVYQHAPGSPVRAPLRRLIGVVSEVYAAFLGAERRARLDLPLTETVPPLATFRHEGSLGPYTFPSDVMRSLAGTDVGVVSLPSAYRSHPLLWGSLAHEVGGHDVLHADPDLLDELAAGVRQLFERTTGPEHPLGRVWAHWIDEAAADVYGVLNLGPQFGLNLLSWLAALRVRWGQVPRPALLAWSGPEEGDVLDPHPTDILRVHLAIGAIASLHRLAVPVRLAYMGLLHAFGRAASPSPVVTLRGDVPSGRDGEVPRPVAASFPRVGMEHAAFLVGQHVATVASEALAGCCIQAIETWGDDDEGVARRIADWMMGGPHGPTGTEDTSHALSGATLAVLADARGYDRVTARLGRALDTALATHPEWAPTAVSATARSA